MGGIGSLASMTHTSVLHVTDMGRISFICGGLAFSNCPSLIKQTGPTSSGVTGNSGQMTLQIIYQRRTLLV